MNFLLKKNLKRISAPIRALNSKAKLLDYKGIRILLYHSVGGRPQDHKLGIRVPIQKFENELEFLVNSGYKTFTVSELVGGRLSYDLEKCIALTFDDGYKDNISIAAPLMKQFAMKATFFITTSYIDGECQKRWTNGIPREYLNWNDVLKLNEMGFEIGSHMIHHIDLTDIDENKLRFELEGSRETICKNIKKEVKVLSYPYGRVNSKVIAIAREIGYIGGCSSISGVNFSDTNRYILERTEIDGYDTIKDFKHKLYGCYD